MIPRNAMLDSTFGARQLEQYKHERETRFLRNAQTRHISIIKYAFLLMAIFFFALFLFLFHNESVQWTVDIAEWAKGTGVWGMVIFAALDAIFVSSMLPGFLFTVFAGAVWGLGLGLLIAVTGKWTGAMGSFTIGRLFCSPCSGWIRNAAGGNGDKLMRAVGKSGWKISLLLRLSPLIPYNVLNFAFAASDITWFDYTWTSLVGMLPGTFTLVYIGHVAGSVSASVKAQEEWTPAHIIMIVCGGLTSLFFLFIAQFIIRKEMEKILQEQELPTLPFRDIDVQEKNPSELSHHE